MSAAARLRGISPARLQRVVGPSAWLVLWIYLYMLALLGGWVLLAALTTGWRPVVITSDSMRPTIRAGDVLLVDDHPDGLLAQQAVVTFVRDDATTVTHRVFGLEGERYVTKGDANPTPDAARVDPEDVTGVGRLIVPLVGMPLVWHQTGNTIALVAWATLSVGAVGAAALASLRYLRHRDSRARREPNVTVTQRGVRRVRVLIGVLILSQYFINPARLDMGGAFGATGLLVLTGTALALVNLGSVMAERRGQNATSRFAVLELVADTTLVIFLTTATGTGGVGWVLFALPIIEAATRFRLAGALTHWMALTAVTLATRIWSIDQSRPGSRVLLGDLEQVLDQLSVLLLVVIPGAYLAEQLVGEVLAQRRATREAQERSLLLHAVARAGKEVSRLDAQLAEAITQTAVELGFAGADLWARTSDQLLLLARTGQPLPDPNLGVGGFEASLDGIDEVVVDAASAADDVERAMLDTYDLACLLRLYIGDGATRLALRVGAASGEPLRSAQVDALRLLRGQAEVAVQNGRLVSQLHELHDELEHQANHDSLTGLANRKQFRAVLRQTLSSWTDWANPPAVLFLDLNGFKQVNDRLGHEVGDHLLKAAAGRLARVMTEPDVLARLGGDEFTVLIRSGRDLDQVATALLATFDDEFRIEATPITISTSIGAAMAEQGLNDGELLRRADTAMYAAKGRRTSTRRFVRYTADLDEADRRRSRLTVDLERAIATSELRLDYQPIVEDKPGHRIVGVEALLRWDHPELGAIGPLEILSLSEASGQNDVLNRWIMLRATNDASAWRRCGARPFFLTVNASPAELDSTTLAANVTDAVMLSGFPGNALFVEISERIVSTISDTYKENMHSLAELGVRFLLDDFGEGRTSLAHLRGLPISGIKLDRMLVANAATAKPDLLILDTVTRLAHELGFFVVAEGVENVAEHVAVTSSQAELIQGYLFHRPMSADAAAALLGAVPAAAVAAPAQLVAGKAS
jgi:signal peptidase I